jgi:hypothetical protein
MSGPIVPFGGWAGWRYLQRTLPEQEARAAAQPATAREIAAFRERIGRIGTAAELVADRTLLKVALGAFGLEERLEARAFLRQVLESPSGDPKALANRLADSRWAEFARAFGFGDPGGPRTREAGFADRIVALYARRQVEAGVGARDPALRFALNADREIAALAARSRTDAAAWFAAMGQRPVRKVLETAFGLPESFARLDLDRQLATFRERARSAFGSSDFAQFRDPARREALIRLYLAREATTATSSASPAVQLLQTARGQV